MEIQQKEKESLAAYIHHFKREVKRCKFTNNTATIRIFVKGLKNAHSLAVQMYEKGPQILTDAMSELEKLQAAQQLTATLSPSSTVNVMSHEEDHCFQCQKLGHIGCHWPNVQCFECDGYSHIVVDCPHRIPPSGTPAHQHMTKISKYPPLHATITKTGIEAIGLHHNPIIADTTAKVTMIPTEAIPGHTTGTTDNIIGVLHDAHTQALIDIILTMTLHITDHIHIESSSAYSRDHSRSCS